jgi:D-arabinose 1-dehydrogenase-like Zn-dependent alcohol dehydrogenase
MKAMILQRTCSLRDNEAPLEFVDFPKPVPGDKDLLVKISVCGVCHTELDYPTHLWHEKEIKSVANVARRDVSEFLKLAAAIPIRPEVQVFKLEEANKALLELKTSKIRGAKVLTI